MLSRAVGQIIKCFKVPFPQHLKNFQAFKSTIDMVRLEMACPETDRPRQVGADSDRSEKPLKMRFVGKPLGTCSKWRIWRSGVIALNPRLSERRRNGLEALPFPHVLCRTELCWPFR